MGNDPILFDPASDFKEAETESRDKGYFEIADATNAAPTSKLERCLNRYFEILNNSKINYLTGLLGFVTTALAIEQIAYDDRSDITALILVGEAIAVIQGLTIQGLKSAVERLDKNKPSSKTPLLLDQDQDEIKQTNCQWFFSRIKVAGNYLTNNGGYILSAYSLFVAVLTLYDYADDEYEGPTWVYLSELISGLSQMIASGILQIRGTIKQKIEKDQKAARELRGEEGMELSSSFSKLPGL